MDSATRASIHNFIEGLPIRVIKQHGSHDAIEQKISDVLFPNKRPRGRPKGSKNKSQDTPANDIVQEKRPRGRPKGSKNKSQDTPIKDIVQEKRPRGRPKGSKNKPKTENIEC